MFWQDVLLDRMFENETLAVALADVVGTPGQDVLIVDDIAAAQVNESVRVLCERTELPGDFPLKLSIFLRDRRLERLNPVSVLLRLCAELDCSCLISDDSEDPYTMLLIDGLGLQRRVSIDPDRYRLDEAYVLVPESESSPTASAPTVGLKR
jgi:hypothetical protein